MPSGLRLREVREHSGFTQARLAIRLHVTVSTVKHWEKGRASFDRYLEKLSAALSVSTGTLLKKPGEPIRRKINSHAQPGP